MRKKIFLIVALLACTAQEIVASDKHWNLEPMLEDSVIVPNGGIFRLWKGGTFNSQNIPQYAHVFEESPYQTYSGLTYNRIEWSELESEENEYLFDKVVKPILSGAYKKRSRAYIGIAINWASTSSGKKIDGRYVAIPRYLFDSLQNSPYPCREDSQYGEAWQPDYDSPLLEERYHKLLQAFSVWLNQPFDSTGLLRKDLVFGIEMRFSVTGVKVL